MREYDIFIPLNYNDGSPVEGTMLQRIQQRLLKEFGGLTYFPQPNQGFWEMGGVTYRDEIVIYRVLSSKRRAAKRYLTKFKEQMKKRLDQEEILIIERDVRTL